MRIAGTIVGIVLILLGGTWTLQGANILKGSPIMSGQSQWLWIGLVVAVIGVLTLWWTWLRRG